MIIRAFSCSYNTGERRLAPLTVTYISGVLSVLHFILNLDADLIREYGKKDRSIAVLGIAICLVGPVFINCE